MNETINTFVGQNASTIRDKMESIHPHLDKSVYLKALFEGIKVADLEILTLVDYAAVQTTGNTLSNGPVGGKFINRVNKALTIARLFEAAFKNNPGGSWIECGVWFGFTGIIYCEIAKQIDPSFDGTGLYLLDSYEGLSEKCDKDTPATFNFESNAITAVNYSNNFICSLEKVTSQFQAYENITLIKGWIPQVFPHVPEKGWSFVHIDVDLYEPTLACLEYFYDRLLPGGIMICDDYLTPWFPGAMKAWDGFCAQRGISFAILDSGQSLIVKDS